MADTKNLVLRTVYMDPNIDDALRNEAFSGRTSKNDLIRDYLLIGMRAVEEAKKTNPAVSAAKLVEAAATLNAGEVVKKFRKAFTGSHKPNTKAGANAATEVRQSRKSSVSKATGTTTAPAKKASASKRAETAAG